MALLSKERKKISNEYENSFNFINWKISEISRIILKLIKWEKKFITCFSNKLFKRRGIEDEIWRR